MNIYDEAIEEIKNAWNGNPLTYPKKTINALERAKKVEEELKYTKEQFDKYWKEVCILKPRLAKVEELLRLYQNNFNIDDVYTSDKNRMKELREEIK